MTSWVIDASVIIKWIIPNPKSEPFTPQALDILEHIQEGQITVFQPPHWLSEVAAVLARIVPNRAEQAIGLLYAMEFSVLEDLDTYTLACQMAIQSQQHVFDTLYHATALCQPNATFVTADDRYFRRAENFGNIVRLKEFSLA
jgi:predicted nucleic acid-binding protein